MKKLVITILSLLVLSSPLFSQEIEYRSQGYKGSVTYTNMIFVWNGIDTSHGYMFNENHYLGAGFGFYLVPQRVSMPVILHFYLDYHAYWFQRKSTPVAGIKLGYARSVHPKDANPNVSAFEIEPNIGWSWATKSGQGLTLSLGAKIMTTPISITENSSLPVSILPNLGFAFEF